MANAWHSQPLICQALWVCCLSSYFCAVLPAVSLDDDYKVCVSGAPSRTERVWGTEGCLMMLAAQPGSLSSATGFPGRMMRPCCSIAPPASFPSSVRACASVRACPLLRPRREEQGGGRVGIFKCEPSNMLMMLTAEH